MLFLRLLRRRPQEAAHDLLACLGGHIALGVEAEGQHLPTVEVVRKGITAVIRETDSIVILTREQCQSEISGYITVKGTVKGTVTVGQGQG